MISVKNDTRARLEQIKDQAKGEDRSLTPSERTEWDKLMQELKDEGELRSVSVMEGEKKKTPGLGEIGLYHAFGVDHLSGERRTWLTSAAGSIVSEHIQKQIFYDLLAQNHLKEAGVQFIKLKPNSRIPVVSAYPDVTWQVEGAAVTPDTSLTIGPLTFGDYNLTSVVKVSQQLIQESEGRSEEAVRGAVSNVFADDTLKMMFSGAGTTQPLGLDGVVGVQTVAGGSAVLTSYDLIIDAVKKLLDENVRLEDISMFAPPVVWAQLAKLKTGIASDLTALPVPPAIAGIKRFTTSAILETYGAGTETQIYIGDFSKAIVGISGDFMLKSDHRYADEFNAAFFFLTRLDIKLLKANAFCMIENIATS